ncbi:MAG: hypothetical protein ACI4NA_06710 [Succinivibrio sp.]
MHIKAPLAAAVLALAACAAHSQEVALYGGDAIAIPDDWKLIRPADDLPSQVPSTIFIAGSKEGCGLRLDNAGEQKQADFKASTAQYDDYLGQLLATAGLKAKASGQSSESKVAGFRSLVKDYRLDIQDSEWGARIVQFNSKNHLYSAWILAPSPVEEQKCFDAAAKVLETFKSK